MNEEPGPSAPERLYCKCGQQIGEIIECEGLPLLRRGNVADRAAHGVCLTCGRAYHWTSSEKQLERLVQMVLRMRAQDG